MATLRLIKDDDSPTPAEPRRAITEEVIAEPGEPAPARPPGEARIQLESLPTPLRAVIRERIGGRMTLAAELPWLGLGTVVHADAADEPEYTGRVQAFAVETTSSGTARLLIFAAPPGASLPPPGATTLAREQRALRRRRWRGLRVGLFVLTAAGLGYTVGLLGRPAAVSTVAPASAETSP